MITTLFEFVHNLDKDGIVYISEAESIEISFEGNRVFSIKSEDLIYGRVLLCRMNEIKRFFIVLKNNTIFSLDELSINEIRNIMKEYEGIKDFESFKLIKVFSSL